MHADYKNISIHGYQSELFPILRRSNSENAELTSHGDILPTNGISNNGVSERRNKSYLDRILCCCSCFRSKNL